MSAVFQENRRLFIYRSFYDREDGNAEEQAVSALKSEKAYTGLILSSLSFRLNAGADDILYRSEQT